MNYKVISKTERKEFSFESPKIHINREAPKISSADAGHFLLPIDVVDWLWDIKPIMAFELYEDGRLVANRCIIYHCAETNALCTMVD